MIKAVITFADKPNVNHSFRIPQSRYGPGDVLNRIYDFVMAHVGTHEAAESAMCFVDLACLDETYETDDLTIEIVEE